jgi:SAM-dependent methyltransferase
MPGAGLLASFVAAPGFPGSLENAAGRRTILVNGAVCTFPDLAFKCDAGDRMLRLGSLHAAPKRVEIDRQLARNAVLVIGFSLAPVELHAEVGATSATAETGVFATRCAHADYHLIGICEGGKGWSIGQASRKRAIVTTISSVENPLIRTNEARRYHHFRPIYHHLPFFELERLVGRKLGAALDVACGTGHSTKELSEICSHVVGCDISTSMLEEARRNEARLQFVQAPAEAMPFESHSFELVNISMGIHWLDQERFLDEAKRLLRPSGYLNIDNYGFSGKMTALESFEKIHKDFYFKHFPAPKRGSAYPAAKLLEIRNFRLLKDIRYEHRILLDLNQFVGFLLTQSNVQLYSAGDPEGVEVVLLQNYEPFFEGKKRELQFSGLSKLYQLGV